MPSTYSGNLLLELMADGENDGLWGDITNKNLEILGRAISGVTTVSLAGTTHTLTVTQGTLSEGHFMVLELGGSPTGTNTITINPNTVARLYIVKNSSGQSAVFTQGSGGNVTVPNGDISVIYCNGGGSVAAVTDVTADFLRASNNLSDLDDPATALQNLGLTATATEINKLDGFTGTADDLNYAKDLRATGVTASEFDKIDGFTGTSADLNYAKDLRATGVTTTEFNKLDGLTASTAELNKLDGFTGTATDLNYAKGLRATGVTTTEFNKLDGLTASTAELNLLDGKTAQDFFPSGGIIMWSGSIASIPSGWALCNGSNGTPDLRDRFVVGAGSSYSVGNTGGANSVTLTEAQMPSHTHSVSGTTNTTGAHTHTYARSNFNNVSFNNFPLSPVNVSSTTGTTNAAGDHSHTVSGTAASTGGGNSHENRPPYLAIAYIMKL